MIINGIIVVFRAKTTKLTDLNSALVQVVGAGMNVVRGRLELGTVLQKGVAAMAPLEVDLGIAQVTHAQLATGCSHPATGQLGVGEGGGTATIHAAI